MDIRCVLLGGLKDESVHEAHERAVGDAVVGLQVVAVSRRLDLLVHVDRDDRADRLGRAHEPLELRKDVVPRRDTEIE